MLLHLVLMLLWIPPLIGWGGTVSLFLFPDIKNKNLPLPNPGELGLLGFVFLGFLGLFLNFFFPLNPIVSTIVLLVGYVFFGINFRRLLLDISLPDWIVLLVVTTVISVCTPLLLPGTDTEYYHLPSLTYIRSFPISFGVANLHGTLGYLSIWFYTAALFYLPHFGLESAFSISTLLFVFFSTSLFSYLRTYPQKSSHQIFAAVFAIGFFIFSNRFFGIAGISHDSPFHLYYLYVWFLILRVLEGEKNTSLLPIALLCALFSLTSKLAGIPTLGFVAIVALYVYYQREKHFRGFWQNAIHFFFKSKIGWFFLITSFLWAVKTVITTGCVVFPQKSTCFFSLPWALPIEEVKYWANDIRLHIFGYSFPKGFLLADLSWVPHWFEKFIHHRYIQLNAFICLLSFFVLIFSLFKKKTPQANLKPQVNTIFWTALLLLGGALLFWFAAAPLFRFGMAPILGFTFLLVGCALIQVGWNGRIWKHTAWIAVSLLLFLCVRTTLHTRNTDPEIQWPYVLQRTIKTFVSPQGVTVYEPNSTWCGMTPQPCTINKNVKVSPAWGNRLWFEPSK